MWYVLAAAGWADSHAHHVQADPVFYLRWQLFLAGVVVVAILMIVAVLFLSSRQRAA